MEFPMTDAQMPCFGAGIGDSCCQEFDAGSYDSTSL
jgi:hypothetical protein